MTHLTRTLTAAEPHLEALPRPSGVSPEAAGSAAIGVAVHLGPALLYVAALSLFGATAFSAVFGLLALSALNLMALLYFERAAPSAALPLPSRAQIRDGLVLVFAKGVLAGGAVVLAVWGSASAVLSPSGTAGGGWLAIFGAVVLTDYAYYWIHRSLNHSRGSNPVLRWYRKNHHLHHSVSELDFFRGNVSSLMDTAVTGFQLSLGLIAAALGLDLASTLTAYGLVLMLQATHHVNHTFRLGGLRFVFMDNHAHKLHHCRRGWMLNLGALFSVWDQLHGTYFEDWQLSANQLHQENVAVPVRRRR